MSKQKPTDHIENPENGRSDGDTDGSSDSATTRKLKQAVSLPGEQGQLVPYDPLQRYLSEISRYPLLTREQEVELGRRLQEEGDPDAAYILATSNLRLVVKIAMEFQRTWMQNLMDLIQEGNIGLMHAVQKFDPYKNVKFSYYAAFWIKAYILKFIMDNWRLVKIGTTQGQRKLFFKLKKEKQKLVEQGFAPETKLLSSRLGVSEQEVRDMDLRLDGWDVSLDEPLKDDSDTERGDFFSSDTESIESQVARKEVESLLREKLGDFKKQLSERELDIFQRRIFTDTPDTLQDIGDKYQISRERVRQLEKNIVKKMRVFFEKEIPDFAAYEHPEEND
ncbi:RNA polymerase sigma-32 factor [Desulfosalsimonas propionicica]|uniref:RNA polymerase sigma factor n=1 Tax=Desulfosalsimonas propionicica TaxID=332175 RepID=A0A7W0C9P3_9BACT|nr:RNA polymerase factor sigma-32 [Desulfosalsimonas propionicica]MBA2881746.1 RNA polymerase sigma-32 factor [Desulfosalsimonas propionicica]